MTQKILLALVGLIIIITTIIVLTHRPRTQAEGTYDGPALPEKRPTDFRIIYGLSTGMIPHSSSLYISEKESYTETSDYGVRQRTNFSISPTELDTLYTIIKQNHFEKIKWHTKLVYDGAGGSISIGWGTTTIGKNIGDAVVMDTGSQQALLAVQSALDALVEKKLSSLRSTLTILVDTSVIKPESLQVTIDTIPTIVFPTGSSNSRQDVISILPGQHRLYATYQLPGTTPSTTATYTIEKNIEIHKQPSTITLFVKNNTLQYTLR